MKYNRLEKRQTIEPNLRQRILVLCLIVVVFCIFLVTIRLVNAKSNSDRIELNKETITLPIGQRQKLKIRNLSDNVTVLWKSSKKSVASVSQDGIVKARKKGEAIISCQIVYENGKRKTTILKCNVNVTKRKKKSVVYMTKDISPEGLMAVYKQLNWKETGKVAVKVSTGEPPASNYLDPDLIGDLVQSVDGTIVECNTAYGGERSSTAMHRQVAKDHGFTEIADVDIMDAQGSMTLSVKGGTHLKKNYVGKHFKNYDSFLVLSHFKGHAMAGFGGAIKNISIGIASAKGKSYIHSGGTSTSGFNGEQNDFLESMAEAGKAVSDSLRKGKNIVYINVMNNLSVDCDCDGYPAKPDMRDIGILASTDPVALDQACVDFIYQQKDGEGASLVKRIESRNGLLTLEHAEKIGLGSRNYSLVTIE